jgi:gamma-glutamyltranspeptidase/glutathione hydrolase
LLIGLVTKDLELYMGFELAQGDRFFIEDPVWAEDFAPNGMHVSMFKIIQRLISRRHSCKRRRCHDPETIRKVGLSCSQSDHYLTKRSTLEQIAMHGAKAFYEGEIG